MSEEKENTKLQPITDVSLVEKSVAVSNRENFEKMLDAKNLWGHSVVGLEAKKAAMTMLSTKTGMYAKLPLVCKSDSCPYSDSCPLLPYDLAPIGEYCPVETAQIELRYISYANEFDLDHSSFTDANLVHEIITLDIMLERCRALMAKEGTPVVDIIAGVSEKGEEYMQPIVSKAWEAYEKMSKKRNEDYQLLMATRKDKKDLGTKEKSIIETIHEAVAQDDFLKVEQRPEDLS